MIYRLALAVSFLLPAAAQTALQIPQLVANYPVIQRGRLGYKVVDLESGEVLASQDSSQFFIPASNTKLYTTALALVRLGPNYTFQTELRTNGAWQPGQASIEDLELVGGGDPNLSGRALPYSVESKDGDPLAGLKDLADKLAATGITRIKGNVVGQASRYSGDAYPDGWTLDDSLYGYGTPISSLSLNDGAVSLSVKATAVGEMADIDVRPSFSHFLILNQVTTNASSTSDIHIARAPGSNEVVLSGTIGNLAPVWKEDLGVEDPALFAAEALLSLLRDRGIQVLGSPDRDYQPCKAGTLLVSRSSAPLWQALQVINKVSQNLHAEMLLREVAVANQGVGTLPAALVEREAFLAGAGITPEATGFSLDDGSGLARQDLTTPDSTIALLQYMWGRPERDIWLRTLPIGGVDGSLQHRFHDIPGGERVHAKTGSLAHVNTLSGYIETAQHRWLAFSIMVNATVGHSKEVAEFLDKFCAIFLN